MNHRPLGQSINAIIDAGLAAVEGTGRVVTAGIDRTLQILEREIKKPRGKARKK